MVIDMIADVAEDNEHEDCNFIHSACCNSHWECVLLKDGTGRLQCVECGMSLSPTLVRITHNIELEACNCDMCGAGKGGN
jgi:formate dehydrogenase maturation protein FdhE